MCMLAMSLLFAIISSFLPGGRTGGVLGMGTLGRVGRDVRYRYNRDGGGVRYGYNREGAWVSGPFFFHGVTGP